MPSTCHSPASNAVGRQQRSRTLRNPSGTENISLRGNRSWRKRLIPRPSGPQGTKLWALTAAGQGSLFSWCRQKATFCTVLVSSVVHLQHVYDRSEKSPLIGFDPLLGLVLSHVP